MTKEELIKTAWVCNNNHAVVRLADFQTFLESNVCIPKGENRHPYADVYHEAVEGKLWQWSEDGINWFDVVPPLYQYRIKPLEPIYEWQWKYKDDNTKLWTFTRYMTDSEFNSFSYRSLNIAIKDEATKKERK